MMDKKNQFQFLDDIFGQTSGVVGYAPEIESMARSRGFKSAEEMMLFERQRSAPREKQTVSAKGAKKSTNESKKEPARGGSKPTSLGGILDYVSAALSGKK